MRTATSGFALVLLACAAHAQESGVAHTLHNLSVSGRGEIRAQSETEVCKFCHIPHNAVVPSPLWGHALSQADRYDAPRIGRSVQRSPQPDGASRLCLSCHDGTIALGQLGRGGTLPMAGAQRLDRGRRSHLGTDLSGSHAISFVVPDTDAAAEDSTDMGLKPLAAIRGDGQVRLDGQGKMQCTTCHDPHADRYYQAGRVPHFWVKPTVDEVCRTCHDLR